MEPKQIALIYGIGLIASVLFLWPVGILALFFFAHMNGDLTPES